MPIIRWLRLTPLLLLPALWAQPELPPLTAAAAARELPPPPAITWLPAGNAYIYQEKKKLLLFECASVETREIASVASMEEKAVQRDASRPAEWKNRRISASRPEFSRDGRKLLLTAKGDLFLVDMETRRWEQLTSTEEPEEDAHLAPDASAVGFRRGNDLYILDIPSLKLRRLTQDGSDTLWNGRLDWVYPEELSLGRAWWWSPDSKSIAYLQFDVSPEFVQPQVDNNPLLAVLEPQRYPKAGSANANVRLGVVHSRGGKTRWMESGETQQHLLARVAWTPDSNRLAIERLSRTQDVLELLLAEAGTGRVRTVIVEKDAAWVNLNDSFRFLPDGKKFLWASERDGFEHLFLYGIDGKLERQLTSGAWEVSQVEGIDGKQVYFTGTLHSPLERHLYSVALSGGDPVRLTVEPGTHSINMSPLGRYYIDAFSSLTVPPRRTVMRTPAQPVSTMRAETERYALQPVEPLQFKGADGTLFYAQVIKPQGFSDSKKYPAVVIVYGGPHVQTVRNAWIGDGLEQLLAAKGFVVWRMDNRGSAARGHAWESVIHRQFGKQELADQVEGVKKLISLGYVDPSRIGIYGWSFGGYMTLNALLHEPEVFAAGAAGAPVTDWRHYDTIYTERYMDMPARNEEGYKASSPVHTAAALKGKLLLLHNFQDDNVLFQNTQQMMSALEAADKHFETAFYPQKTHHVSGQLRKHLYDTIVSFFERSLQTAKN